MNVQEIRPHIFVVGARGIPDVEGGAEKNAESLFPRVLQAGFDVTLLSLRRNAKGEDYKGVKILAAPEIWLFKTEKIAYYIVAIFHAVRLRPDIIHLQGLGSALFLFLYRLLGFRIVVRYGSADYTVSKWGFVGRAGFLLAEYQLRFAHAVISVTDALSRRLAARGIRDNVHLIPNALDVIQATPPDSGDGGKAAPVARYVLAVGRITAQKNIDMLVKGFSRFSQANPGIELWLAGGLEDTAYVDALRQGLPPNVMLLGKQPRSRIPSLLKSAALYVNLSHHEGSSNATLEAISHGCPVLLSDIPENRDMTLPEHIYVDQNSESAIAAALSAAMAEPRRFVVDKNSFLQWQDVADKTVSIYRRLVA